MKITVTVATETEYIKLRSTTDPTLYDIVIAVHELMKLEMSEVRSRLARLFRAQSVARSSSVDR